MQFCNLFYCKKVRGLCSGHNKTEKAFSPIGCVMNKNYNRFITMMTA